MNRDRSILAMVCVLATGAGFLLGLPEQPDASRLAKEADSLNPGTTDPDASSHAKPGPAQKAGHEEPADLGSVTNPLDAMIMAGSPQDENGRDLSNGERMARILNTIANFDRASVREFFSLAIRDEERMKELEGVMNFGSDYFDIAIISRWAEVDELEDSVAFMQRAFPDDEGDLNDFLAPVWALSAPDEVLRYADKSADEDFKSEALQYVAMSYARNSPLKALNMLHERGYSLEDLDDPGFFIPQKPGEIRALVGQLSAEDAPEEWANYLPGVLMELAKDDPAFVAEKMQTLDDGGVQSMFSALTNPQSPDLAQLLQHLPIDTFATAHTEKFKELFRTWSTSKGATSKTRDRLLEVMAGVSDEALRQEMIEPLMTPKIQIRELAKDPVAYLQTALESPELFQVSDYQLRHALMEDTEKTWEFLAQHADEDNTNIAINDVFGDAMLAEGIGAAKARIDSIPAGELRKKLLRSAGASHARNDPAAAVAWLQTLPAEDRYDLWEPMSDELLRHDPALAMKALEFAPQDTDFDDALGAWAEVDVIAAVAWLQERDDFPAELVLESSMVRSIAEQGPTVALEFADQYADSEVYPELISEVIDGWLDYDLNGAANFIEENLEPGPTRDSAVQSLVWGLRADPVPALEWTATIQDDERRNVALGWINRMQADGTMVSDEVVLEAANNLGFSQEEVELIMAGPKPSE